VYEVEATRGRVWLRTLHHVAYLVKVQAAVRGWSTRHRSRKARERTEHTARRQEGKDAVWEDVSDLSSKAIKPPKNWRFAGSIRTDGTSIRLMYNDARRTASKKGTKRPRCGENLPRRGLYTIDQIKHFSRANMQLVGADPGKRELLVCVDADDPDTKDAQATRRKVRFPSVRYTNAQHPAALQSHAQAFT